MFRKDYKLLADWIKNIKYSSITIGMLYIIVDGLCSILKKDNSNFDKQKFMDACNL